MNSDIGSAAMKSKPAGRRTLLYLVSAGCVIIVVLFLTYGYENTWRLWNVPALMPYLGDARVITAGAESHKMGYDPLIYNQTNNQYGVNYNRMNYPRIWQLLFFLGIDQSDTIYFGVVFAGLFFAGVFLITNDIDRPTAWLMAGAIFSPAVLLGMERGNNDLFIFFLLALVVYLAKKSRAWTATTIGLAFLLKLYPIFALIVFLRENKRVFKTVMACAITICTTYSVIMFRELRLIREATPAPTGWAYGINVGWLRAALIYPHAVMPLRLASYGVALLIGAITLYLGGRRTGMAQVEMGHLDAFRVSAAIYIGTFLIGANWDYRLMFLLLALPQLMSWRRSSSKDVRRVAIITTAFTMLSLWLFFLGGMHGHLAAGPALNALLGQAFKWIVFSGLLYLLGCSLPEWLKLPLPYKRAAPVEPTAV